MRRLDIKTILADAPLRRKLMVETIRAIQAREGIDTTLAQAERAYDKVHCEPVGTGITLRAMGTGPQTMRNDKRIRKMTTVTLGKEALKRLDERRGNETRSGFIERLILEGVVPHRKDSAL